MPILPVTIKIIHSKILKPLSNVGKVDMSLCCSLYTTHKTLGSGTLQCLLR